jgi:hypothetical protein
MSTLFPCLEAQCNTMLCFSRLTYAILRLSWYSILCSILAGASISLQSPCRCQLSLDSSKLSLLVKAQCDTMLCFSRLTYAILRAILRLSWYSILWVRSILACASQCSLHADVNCAQKLPYSPFEWKHSATSYSASQNSLMPYWEPYSGYLDTQFFEYIVSWLVHLDAVSMQM